MSQARSAVWGLIRAASRQACAAAERAGAQQRALFTTTEQSPSGFGSAFSGWGRMSMGLAAVTAASMAFSAPASATPVAAAAAAPEVVVADGVKISASGGAKIKHDVVFVLGGPGSGKGTQCSMLLADFDDVAHFSAGDLLREHVNSGTPDGNMVADMIKNGQIVPAEITVGLLKAAMESSGKSKVLIDGFPRNDSNREVFQKVVGYDCSIVLFFDCPEDVLEARLLSRNQGRVDDNIETIKKRFKVFLEQSLPVIGHYDALGKVRHIDTNRAPETIYKEVRSYISDLGH